MSVSETVPKCKYVHCKKKVPANRLSFGSPYCSTLCKLAQWKVDHPGRVPKVDTRKRVRIEITDEERQLMAVAISMGFVDTQLKASRMAFRLFRKEFNKWMAETLGPRLKVPHLKSVTISRLAKAVETDMLDDAELLRELVKYQAEMAAALHAREKNQE